MSADLLELIEAAAALDHGVLRFAPAGVEHGVGQVWATAGLVARWVRGRYGAEAKVGAFLSNTPDCPAAVIGTWRAGGTLVSLPYPSRGSDVEAFTAQLTSMCVLAEVDVLLVDDAYRAFLPPNLPVPVATFAEAASGGPVTNLDGSANLIQFTSGSLGSPRGVVLSGPALGANVTAIMDAIGVGEHEKACSWLPLSHDMGFVGMFLTALAGMGPDRRGDMILLQTPESFLADPASWLRHCGQIGATITTAPNFAFELAVRSRRFLGPDLDLAPMRVCITGAERVQAGTLAGFTETFADAGLSPLAICPAYGMAEASLAITVVRPEDPWRDLALDRRALGEDRLKAGAGEDAVHYVSNGTPVAGLEVRIAGTDGAEVGEVQVRGTSMFRGYLGADAAIDAQGWFSTRDLGFLQEGELFLVGRSDESIIVGGRNHYAPDIEQAVDHPLVRRGCLAAVPLEDGYALVAEPVGSPGRADLEKAARELAAGAARRTSARPSYVAFVPRGRLPKTPSGKLRRLPLAAALRTGDIEILASVPPRGPLP